LAPTGIGVERFRKSSDEFTSARSQVMSHVIYVIFEHDGGWAYRVGGTVSETYPSRDIAHKAAESAAREQRTPGETAAIQYETPDGAWTEESSRGSDRPETEVKG
jgi:hypothetical protein